MKTRSKALMVGGVVVVLLGGMVRGQGPGRGQGWGPGPMHRAGGPNQGGMGMGTIPHAGGPMGPGVCVFGCPFGPARSSVLGPAAWSLNLAETQIKQIRSIYDQARADANSVEQAVAKAHIALHQAVISGASEMQIQAAATSLGTALGNQAVLHAKTLAAAKTVLTAEQRKELDNLPGKMATLQHSGQGPNPVITGQSVAHGAGSGGVMSLDQMFNAADTNKDGTLTLNEFNVFQGKMGGQIRHQ
jgi:Spy/CpxP family protein refolding chaperone